MSTLSLPQARIPIAWAMINGVRTPCEIDIEWMRSMAILAERAGGVSGVSTTELVESSFEDAGIPELSAQLFAGFQGVGQAPSLVPTEPVFPIDNTALMARIDVLETAIQELRQR